MRWMGWLAIAAAVGCGNDEGTSGAGGAGGVAIASCPERTQQAAALEPMAVSAASTEPALEELTDHYVLEPAVPAASKLFVFLGGSTSQPLRYLWILRVAATAGYHAIGLAYGTGAISDFCAIGDLECPGNARQEILTGEDVSPEFDVDRAHSIENRLVKLLQAVGWTQYLDGTNPRWQNITLAGHSKGAGQSAFVGKLYVLNGVVMFASWNDQDAAWTSRPVVTDAARYAGFAHVDDLPSVGWDTLGIPGAPTSVDEADPPYGSQRLTTSIACTDAHGCVVHDADTPFDAAGLPLLSEPWCELTIP